MRSEMPDAPNMVEILRRRQSDLRLTDAQFADAMGVSRTMWSLVRSGKRGPGRNFIRGVLRRFPDLTSDLLVTLRDQGVFLPQNVADSHEYDANATPAEVPA